MDNVLTAPHIGGADERGIIEIFFVCAEGIDDFLSPADGRSMPPMRAETNIKNLNSPTRKEKACEEMRNHFGHRLSFIQKDCRISGSCGRLKRGDCICKCF